MTELTPELVAELKRNVPPQRELEGIEIAASEPGGVRYEIDVPSSVLNYHGTIHGGFVSTLLEVAAGMAAYAYGVSGAVVARERTRGRDGRRPRNPTKAAAPGGALAPSTRRPPESS
ncbi:MAG: hotdog domain-containing protein [Gordonibacter pamelaeae]